MGEHPRSVSVAMATFNGQKFIKQQLESLAAQSHLPAELVITDDASNDDTLSIAADFAKSSPFPVQIHRNDNRLGYRANFMRAASLCKFDLIAFCDQDDRWYPTKIEHCIRRFDEPEILLVYHDADVITDQGTSIGRLDRFSVGTEILLPLAGPPLSHVLGFTQVFRSSLLQLSDLWPMSVDHLFDNERMAHDQWFYFLASVMGKIAYLNEPLAAYMQHGQNAFGYGAPIDRFHKTKTGLKNSVGQIARRAAAANSRARILEAAKIKLDEMPRERAMIGAERYQRLSELNVIRKEIYTSSTLTKRLAVFYKLFSNGAYGGKWSLSGKALIKDITFGIPASLFLTRSL